MSLFKKKLKVYVSQLIDHNMCMFCGFTNTKRVKRKYDFYLSQRWLCDDCNKETYIPFMEIK